MARRSSSCSPRGISSSSTRPQRDRARRRGGAAAGGRCSRRCCGSRTSRASKRCSACSSAPRSGERERRELLAADVPAARLRGLGGRRVDGGLPAGARRAGAVGPRARGGCPGHDARGRVTSPRPPCPAIPTTRPRRACSRGPRQRSRLVAGGRASGGRAPVRRAQGVSQLEEILQVSTKGVDDNSERKREAAHGLDRVNMFSGRKRHMSSPILPISDPLASTENQAIRSRRGHPCRSSSELTAGEGASPLDRRSRGGPPPEVLDQIAAAGKIEERLREDGRQLRFSTGQDGHTIIEVRDNTGADDRAPVRRRGARDGRRKATGVGLSADVHLIACRQLRSRRPDHDHGPRVRLGNDQDHRRADGRRTRARHAPDRGADEAGG